MAQKLKVNLSIPGYFDATEPFGNGNQDFGDYGIAYTDSDDFMFDSFARQLFLSRFRREEKNNWAVAGICSKFPQAIGDATLRIKTSNTKFNVKKEKWWTDRKNTIFADGTTFEEEFNILRGEMLRVGERFYVKLAGGQIRPVPSECCGSFGSEVREGERNGIVYDKSGKPKFYKFAPKTNNSAVDYTQGKYYPANAVIHVYAKERSSHGRGLPWMLASLVAARDLYEIFKAKTSQIKALNKLFGVIQKPGFKTENGVTEYDAETDTEKEVTDDVGNAQVQLKDNTFVELEPGQEVKNLNSDYKASDYKEFIHLMLYAVSAPLGIPIELWWGGINDVTYAGFKGLGTNWENRRNHYCEFFKEKFLYPVFEFINDFDIDEGLTEAMPEAENDRNYWVIKSISTLDEQKDAQAAITRIRSGISDVGRELERRGEFVDEVFQDRVNQYKAAVLARGGKTDGLVVPMEFILTGASKEPTYEEQAVGAAPGAATTVADTALNGAQVASLVQVITQVSTGLIPMETGKAIARAAFPAMKPELLDEMFAALVNFKPATPQP